MLGDYFSVFSFCQHVSRDSYSPPRQHRPHQDERREDHNYSRSHQGFLLAPLKPPSKPLFEMHHQSDDVAAPKQYQSNTKAMMLIPMQYQSVPQEIDALPLEDGTAQQVVPENDPVVVHALNGAVVALVQSTSETTIQKVKAEIQQCTQIPTHEQRLTYEDRVLQDSELLPSISSACSVLTMVRMKEAPFASLDDIHYNMLVQVLHDYDAVRLACEASGSYDESLVRTFIGGIAKVNAKDPRDNTVRIQVLDALDKDDTALEVASSKSGWLPVRALCSASLLDHCRHRSLAGAKQAYAAGGYIDSEVAEAIAAAWFNVPGSTTRNEWQKLGQLHKSWEQILLKIAARSICVRSLLLEAEPDHISKMKEALDVGLDVHESWIDAVVSAWFAHATDQKLDFEELCPHSHDFEELGSSKEYLNDSMCDHLESLARVHPRWNTIRKQHANDYLNQAIASDSWLNVLNAQTALLWGATLSKEAAILVAKEWQNSDDEQYCRELEDILRYLPDWDTFSIPYCHIKGARSVASMWVETDCDIKRAVWQVMRTWYGNEVVNWEMHLELAQSWLNLALRRKHVGMAMRAMECGARLDRDAARRCARSLRESLDDRWDEIGSTFPNWPQVLLKDRPVCYHASRGMACMCDMGSDSD